MHLKSVTLKGFKSFAQATTFAFEPGVTAIVGPNGSGKSNVVDALAWVMGEQGAKTLRGGRMDDVIFAGTATRGPLGRAEVTLTIDNHDGVLPIEYAEVTIGRTLFRNGQSEYAINGEACRLLDVQELLSDSGLGREMHVIVGQGRLDSVLAATPEDRRGFIEEAAGILKHRRRKERTLRKLEAMEANLTRLSDLAGELRRQLKPLGRQAELAREAAVIAATVRDARARLYADEVVTLRAELAAQAAAESDRHAERMIVQDRAATLRAEADRLEAEARLPAVDDARRTVHALEQAHDRLRSLDALVTQRIALLAEDDAPAMAVTVSEAAIAAARAEADALAAGVDRATDAAAAAVAQVAAARADLEAHDAELAGQAAAVSRHDIRLSTLRGARETADSRHAALDADLRRRRAALAAARDRRADAEDALAAIPEAGDAETAGGALAADYDRAVRAATEAEETATALRDRRHAAEREVDALSAQTAALSRALASRGGGAALEGRGVKGARGLVGDAVQVRGGWEAAIAAALGDLADGLLVDGRGHALDALDRARDAGIGVVDLVVADAAPAETPAVSGLERGADVVDAPAGVRGLLDGVYLAEDLAAVRAASAALAAADPDGRAVVVTRAGEVVGRYVLRGGSGESSSRIRLVADRDAAAERLAELQVVVDSLREAAADAAGRHDEARRHVRTAFDALRAHESAVAAHGEAVHRAAARSESAAAEADRLEAALAEIAAELAAAAAAAREAATAFESAAAEPRPTLDPAAREAAQRTLDETRERALRARLEVETLRERVRSAEAAATALQDRRDRERAAAAEAARRTVLRRAQRAAAAEVATVLPAVLASAAGSLDAARGALGEAESARTVVGERLRVVRAEEAAVRDRLSGLVEAVHSLELASHERRLHLAGVVERAASDLGVDEAVLVADSAPGEDFDRIAERRRLQGAEAALERLGRINPLALEEFAALEQRHAFLTDQLADLGRTRADLLTIVGELDERMQQIFLAAFEDTREAFAEVFPILFPGGSGSIALTDPDQPLTTGIEVSARPAGKRIERLSLLSGGERSLAAVALLAAIFTARPSPFYILDEVEAALDDANLGRLLGVVERLRQSSQLIVITHQKRTMEVADALYGVSMRQDGVSAVVGQRLVDRAAS